MRPIIRNYDPANVDTDGLVDGATGVTTPLVQLATSAGDGLAHQLNITSTADLSGITFTVTGTDADGIAQTEAITGPNNTTVESTKYFLTVTSIAISATLGANTADIGWVDEFVTPTLPLNWRGEYASLRITPTGTIDYTVQVTYTPLTSAPDLVWSDAPADVVDMTDVTAEIIAVLEPPPVAMRLQVNSYTDTAELDLQVVHTR